MVLPKSSLYLFSRARSAGFAIEFALLNSLSYLLPPSARPPMKKLDPDTVRAVHADLLKLLKRDSENIAAGTYPASVLTPESPIQHLRRIPKVALDAFSINRRRLRGKTTDFDRAARTLLEGLPRYYRRNFHYQTNGYLSRHSAEVYDHQVELLFKGSADAMRRLVIPPLRKKFGRGDGEGLRFLELGCGTGRATRFIRLAFPKAKIVAIDLSPPYLDFAQKSLADLTRVDFLQADAARLPFKKGEFDAVCSVFLFHELPLAERKKIIVESSRVLRRGGLFAFVDSLQTGDKALFDPLLKDFPKDFHEPFYRDYIAHPMEESLKDQSFLRARTSYGFSSKVCMAQTSSIR